MADYQRHEDLAKIPEVLKLADKEGQAFMAFNHAAERDGGLIPRKYRELISIAVALTTQCSYCIDVHTRNARENGVSKEELAEVAFVAAAVRAGGTLGHSLLALRLFEDESSSAST
ncbi:MULTISPECIES: carboxymuconolactone decarboxylase family protein [unclassified Bradyrhizobium]|uniref:carboxymuconolactone decarboxylase family protein n=1 Tax=unclassified Bradyrhizobium TaxID=2631580 RepID=UPI00247A59BF|nr:MULTISPECIES: carboxymuconolactone decarboxylase family protein [unclassified Bradyrhizobium]WGR73796.1 carboxymuconolactone decarboxylase family protein [Bradyrhizobium sp. ISRA426]WGR78634.1 carboxymuconolactone decarboxylase family protein [Bradyrhizobium sp. ISRA430]WGR89035.1 carboxymuconolactone decarboxylase family protein [Bradyrhizobium sp. ISRA432]